MMRRIRGGSGARIRGGYDAPHQRGGLETRKIDQNLTSPKWSNIHCSMGPKFEFLAILDLPLAPKGPLLQYFGDRRRIRLRLKMTPKWPKSVKKSLKAEHCMLKALENGLSGHPFPERMAKRPFKRPFVGWLRAHPSLFFSVPVPLSSSFAPALRSIALC